MTRIGIQIEGQEGLTWTRWRALCGLVERLGFASLWRSDHLLSFYGVPDAECIETWTSLTLAAHLTSQIEFGTLVTSMTFRHPVILARMAATVDQLAGGRLVVGLGAGGYESEHRRFGIPFPAVGERMDRLEQGIQTMRETWLLGHPSPVRNPPPILVGGMGERRLLRIVARHANEWNFEGTSVEQYRRKATVLRKHCGDVGRDPNEIRHSLMIGFIVGRDRTELHRRALALGEVIPAWSNLTPVEVLARAEERFLIGSPAEIVDRLADYRRAGIDRFMLQHLLLDDDDALRLLAAQVAPRV